MQYVVPAEGLPLYHAWLETCKDLMFRGYEPFREVIEVKFVEGWKPGQPLDFGCLIPTKGLGRVSMLLWCVMASYIHLRAEWTPGMQADFVRLLGCKCEM